MLCYCEYTPTGSLISFTFLLESRVGQLSLPVGSDAGSETTLPSQEIAPAVDLLPVTGKSAVADKLPVAGPAFGSVEVEVEAQGLSSGAISAATAKEEAKSAIVLDGPAVGGRIGSDNLNRESFSLLDPRSMQLGRLYCWIATLIVGVLLTIAWAFVGFVFRETFDLFQWLLLIPIGAVIALGGYLGRLLPVWEYENSRWRIAERGIEIQRGIWWRHRIFIAMDRIQHTDVQQGPLMRWYGLATLVVSTGGTHEPSIPLYGLSHDVAEQVRDKLSNCLSDAKQVHDVDSGGA